MTIGIAFLVRGLAIGAGSTLRLARWSPRATGNDSDNEPAIGEWR